MRRALGLILVAVAVGGLGLSAWLPARAGYQEGRTVEGTDNLDSGQAASIATDYDQRIRPVLTQYCLGCHSEQGQEGGLDLERFSSLDQVRKHLSTWQNVLDKLEKGEMPPADQPQPEADERRQLLDWVRNLLETEARAGAGDPGRVVLRRLSNAEYNNTIRDLTGVDFQPARQFPIDGAAGEGFTNAGDALVISSVLLDKYWDAAKEIAAHAMLLPEGVRFSASTDQRVSTDKLLAELREFYAEFAESEGGRIPLQRYLNALVRYRNQGEGQGETLEAIAAEEKLSEKYLRSLWEVLSPGDASSFALGPVRALWQKTKTPEDVPALQAEIAKWQDALWTLHYGGGEYDGVGYHPWQNPKAPEIVEKATGEERLQLERQAEEFRRWFPLSLCYNTIVPIDSPVTLWMFYREDEPLGRLMLDERQQRRLEQLWAELHYISQDAIKVQNSFDLVVGFASQVGCAPAVEKQRESVRKRAEEFQQELLAAEPSHQQAILDFATRAYRRPLVEQEKQRFQEMYAELRKQGNPHPDAIRTLLTRILISPSFLYRIERSPAGNEPERISDWELATRLSYFLWSSMPDAELTQAAESGYLHQGDVLTTQVQRMLNDDKVRQLAIEFGTQWLHVRGFDSLREKNEALFPTFDEMLRQAIYEESIRFFQDLFQSDRSVLELIDCDHTFLNETLAKHYGIPDVNGAEWRRVEGVKQYGRGGLLTLASVLAKQSGASRTSPILRGNWFTETLLGEKMPKPPANVPRLPEEETGGDELTVRQLVEKHTQVAECAVCHERIDPFGFALEQYDPIGRFRPMDLAGRPLDTKVKLKDGTEFTGVDGLRQYLLKDRQQDFLETFCKKLLGFALGRAVTLSDRSLLEEMNRQLQQNDYRISAAVMCIIRSKQFQFTRGLEATKEQ